MVKAIGNTVLALAAAASLGFVQVMRPTTLETAVWLSAWLAFPYFLLAAMLAFFGRKGAVWALASVAVCIVVAASGLLFVTVVVFLRPDAQGALAVVFMPIWQLIAAAVLLPLFHWLIGRRGARPG
jgi:hypothetical protein